MRIHVLGVGSIGTLVAFELRRRLRPNHLHPISLLVQRKGIPGPKPSNLSTGRAESSPLETSSDDQTGVVLSYTQGNRDASVSGFDLEISGTRGADLDREMYERRFRNYSKGSPAVIPPVVSWSDEPIQSLIVTLKCQSTLHAVSQLRHRIAPDSVITLLQNGMGVYDELCDQVWPDKEERPQFILGSTTHGAQLTHPKAKVPGSLDSNNGLAAFRRHVLHNGRGDVKFGVVPDPRGIVDYNAILFPGYPGDATAASPSPSPSLPLPPLSSPKSLSTEPSFLEQTLSTLLSLRMLSPSLLPMPQMHHSLLLKVAINAAINPITAILDLKNGEILGNRSAEKLIGAICTENSKIITTYLYSLAGIPPTDVQAHQTSFSRGGPPPDLLAFFSPESLERQVMTVLTKTAPNVSSMLSDIRRGTRYTEIDYISGYLIGLATRMGVPADINRMFYSMVLAKSEFMVKGPRLPSILLGSNTKLGRLG